MTVLPTVWPSAELPLVRGDQVVFPTSFAQRRLWFIHQLDPASPVYNVPLVFGISGALDVDALERSLSTIVARHEPLRTTFIATDGEPLQLIGPSPPLALASTDLQRIPEAEREVETQGLIQEEISRPFALETGPLIRMRLLRTAPGEHILVLVVHHIVFDGWSAGVFSRELSECYRAFVTGNAPRLPELAVQYADFAVWQRACLTPEVLERHLAYWRTQLAGAAPLGLPTDRSRPRTPSRRGASQRVLLAPHIGEALNALAEAEGATSFMVLLAGYQALLARYSGQSDVTVGTPIANRTRMELEPLIGFFVNSLAMRADLSGDPSFREHLRRVRETALGAYEHQDLPFERLVEELNPDRAQDRNPIFQAMFTLPNTPRAVVELPGITLRSLPRKTGTSKFDLTLSMHQEARGLRARMEYSTDLFGAETITAMLANLENLLRGVAADPDRRLSRVPLLQPSERSRVLVEWNQTDRAFAQHASIHALVEAMVAEHPGATALEAGAVRLTYRELNGRANRLARYLRGLGVGPEVPVAVCLERSADWVVTLLAVLKAGGAYVPLDPDYPAERLAFMLGDAKVRVLVTQASDLAQTPTGVRVVSLSADRERIGREAAHDLGQTSSGDNLAYVMYTSGSTGAPKGVAVPHGAVVRLVTHTDYVQLTTADRVAQISNASFDAATFEIWGALVNGARLVILDRQAALSPAILQRELHAAGITTIFLTTSVFNQVAREAPRTFRTVRHVLFGGEAADPRSVREILQHSPPERLLNVYGPTETTTFATWHLVREVDPSAERVPIGRPIANTRAYVLDTNLEPVPAGIQGELYIGGPGLARGYVSRPALTAERFVPDPFSPHPGGRLYRTGDRARWLLDGTLECFGRFDAQVKLRGYRIEPQEIEAVLAQRPDLRECAVVLREDLPTGRGLVAYVVPGRPTGGGDRLAHDLRSHLRQRLPEYMIPSAFVELETLPLSPNGKLDRRALPPPDPSHRQRVDSFLPPRTGVEEALARVWQQLLGVDRVAAGDNFFALGGHSLLAGKLFANIERVFGRRLPLSTLFLAPTLEQLAEAITQHPDGETSATLVLLREGDKSPPLVIVHGVYGHALEYRPLLDRLDPEQTVYAIEIPAGDGAGPVLRTLEDLAAQYVQVLRQRQPVGPYLLCGYCWAGPVAFEMARQLHAARQEVDLLAIIDARCRVRHRSLHSRLWGGIQRIAGRITRNLQRLRALHQSAVPAFVRQRIANAGLHLFGSVAYHWSVRLQRPLLPLFHDLSATLIYLERSYRPRSYPGRVTVFLAQPSSPRQRADLSQGWSRVAAGGVESHTVAGSHLSLMRDPYVEDLANQLRECLERAVRARS